MGARGAIRSITDAAVNSMLTTQSVAAFANRRHGSANRVYCLMRPNVLCRERLHRLLTVLERQGGHETLRQLWRRFRIWDWEVEEAEALGWVKIGTTKPRVGRPSRFAVKLSKTYVAKLPPPRWAIPRSISIRHWWFALRSTHQTIHRGSRVGPFSLPGDIEAYRTSFPGARSRNGAAASCSRLLRHPHVVAARQWFYANGREFPKEDMPTSARAIWERLYELGSWRVRWAPYSVRLELGSLH